MRILAAIAFATTLLITLGCNGEKHTTPRKTAYPRPNLLDTTMTTIPEVPLFFPINAQAKAEVPQPGWLNIVYDRYKATLHTTFTESTSEQIDEIKHNRMERLLLNSGGRPTQHSEFTNSAGFSILVAYTEGATTPLQFLATDDSSIVVSGALYFSDPRANQSIDSIKPIIEAIRGDMMRSLQRLSFSTHGN